MPLIVKAPGLSPGRRRQLVGLQDVLPTLCDLAGVASPGGIDGLSFLPTLLGQTDRQKPHAYLYWEFHERGGKRAVRKGRWKAIQRNLNKKTPGPVLLFDLATDLGEQRNVADAHPEIVAEMKRLFAEAHTPSAIWRFGGVKGG